LKIESRIEKVKMKSRTLYILTILCLLAFKPAVAQANLASAIPHLEKKGTATQLIVEGKPFLVLGGELHNSSSSNIDYMDPILAKFSASHFNTALAAVDWDMIEPQEGRFDFGIVDGLIQDARRHNLRLVLLWFGSWKNGVSTYPPIWVKTDQERFPRALDKDGKGLEILSTFSVSNRDADARAFAALMRHVGSVDGTAHTVLMIQVENEVGILTESRDQSPAASAAYRRPVPKELMDYLGKNKETLIPGFRKIWEAKGFKTSGTWEDVFGAGEVTDEIFMAWNYAHYVGSVAEAGKAEYALPMFVNTWLATWQETAPLKAGDYPSGGPMPHMLDVWKAGAPKIDILAPDVYSYFDERCGEYRHPENPLFMPEIGRDMRIASDIFSALGEYEAIGVSPFGVESVPAFEEELGKSYEVLAQIAPIFLDHQGKGAIGSAVLDKSHATRTLKVGDYTLDVGIAHHYTFPTADYPAGVFIAIGPDEYLVAGRGLTVAFTPTTAGPPIAGLATVEEGVFVNGKWVAGRRLNGDEILSGKGLRLPGD
jgi:beta-galactosidase GanA